MQLQVSEKKMSLCCCLLHGQVCSSSAASLMENNILKLEGWGRTSSTFVRKE